MTKEELEKENTELKNKMKNIKNYLAYDIPHELINEATNKIWHIVKKYGNTED